MVKQINIVWTLTPRFQQEDLNQVLTKFNAQKHNSTNEYEKGFWKFDGIIIKLYEKKLLVQGKISDYSKNAILDIKSIEGLSLDTTNSAKLRLLFPTSQNAIICNKCGCYSLQIDGTYEGLDIVFKKECNHIDKLNAPLAMTNSRILPDINILISGSLSRLINIGYFKGFEIVIPDFIIDVIDEFKGTGKKGAVTKEIKRLRSLENSGLITIMNIENEIIKIHKTSDLSKEEDKIILQLAQITNAVLITGDELLRTRALMKERPTIYISPEIFGKIKIIESVRNP